MSLIAAIDAGASEIKASLFDLKGGEVAHASRDCPTESPSPGWAQGSPDILLMLPIEVLREAVSRSGATPADVAAIGVTGSRATVLPFDGEGVPVGPVIFWYDLRSEAETAELAARFGADRFFETTGVPLDRTPSITKILWLRTNMPESFAKAAMFALPQSVVLNTLVGRGWYCDTSYGPYFGLMQLSTQGWSDELLAATGVDAIRIPELVLPGARIGGLADAPAKATGLNPGIPVIASASDAACYKLGAGLDDSGRAGLYVGTAGAVGMISARPVLDPRLTCCPSALAGRFDVDALLLTGGSAYRWLRDVLVTAGAQVTFADLDRMAAAIPAGSEGLVIVPHLAGAGSPLWNAAATGMITGLRLSHGPGHLARAIMEGVAFAHRHALDALQETAGAISSLQITGGGSSPIWAQIMADVTGLPAFVPDSRELTALGAAVMAGVGAGLFADPVTAMRGMNRPERRFEPDPNASVYADRYQAYLGLVSQFDTGPKSRDQRNRMRKRA